MMRSQLALAVLLLGLASASARGYHAKRQFGAPAAPGPQVDVLPIEADVTETGPEVDTDLAEASVPDTPLGDAGAEVGLADAVVDWSELDAGKLTAQVDALGVDAFVGDTLKVDIPPIEVAELTVDLGDVLDTVDGAVGDLENIVDSAGDLVADVVDTVTDVAEGALDAVVDTVVDLTDNLVPVLDNVAERLVTNNLRLFSSPRGFAGQDRCSGMLTFLQALGTVLDPSRRSANLQELARALFHDLNCLLDDVRLLNDLRQRLNLANLFTPGQGIGLSSNLLGDLQALRRNLIHFGFFLETAMQRLELNSGNIGFKKRELSNLLNQLLHQQNDQNNHHNGRLAH